MLTVEPKPLWWHKLTSTVAILSPLRRQNYSFSLIFVRLCLPKVLFVFSVLYFGFHTWLEVLKVDYSSRVSKVHSVWHNVDYYYSHFNSTPCINLKSTLVASQSPLRATQCSLRSHYKVRSVRQSKVDFGFQVASQSPLCTAQSRLRFSCRILKSSLLASKVNFGRI
jgi:hypothetical protein